MTGGQMTNPGARAAQPGLSKAGNGNFIADDARAVTLRLKGRWHGRYGSAPCPCCQAGRKDQNALTIGRSSSGRLLLDCKKSACSFTAILAAAGLSREWFIRDPLAAVRYEREARADAERKSAMARRLWLDAMPLGGTPAAIYLASRGLKVADRSRALRFHRSVFHGPSGLYIPAMLALVEGGEGFAVHRTYLTADGEKAVVDPVKMTLGACAGGAVRLICGNRSVLAVAEGIESALSIPALDPLLTGASIWAALSASGMRSLRLPSKAGALVIFADGDQPGRSAAHALAERAAALGWQVRIADPGDGLDPNDVLRGREVASC